MRSIRPRNLSASPSSFPFQDVSATPDTGKNRNGVRGLLIALLLCSALVLRVWHDHHRATAPVALTPATLEQRAHDAPNDVDAQFAWANSLKQQARNSEAMDVFANCARLAPRDARPYVGLASLAIAEERWDIARVNLREALKYTPDDPELWRTLGGLYLRSRKNRDALNAYTHATRLRPDDAGAWRQRGMLEAQAGMTGGGYDALAHAVALNPQDIDAQYALGVSALRTGKLPDARQAFEKVLALRPADVNAQIQLANVNMQLNPSPEGLAQAQRQLGKVMDLDTTGAARAAQGHLYLLQRKYELAVRELRAGLAADKTEPTSYVYLSQAYAALGKQELARRAGAEYQRLTAKDRTRAADDPAPGETR